MMLPYASTEDWKMPPNEPATSSVPLKNARFSGRFDRCTWLSSSRASSVVHLNAAATTPMCWSG